MSNLQQHYLNFQILQTKESKIEYLKQQQSKLSQYNINVPNLIRAWSTNDWPHLRPKQTNPGF
jgi:hypothetical protein|tara:strand:- start:95 stop:283 length:189 start_codon:yes stop_codon:yes gene_type:complete